GVRMFTPIAALTGRHMTLTGRGSLLKRPVCLIEKSLLDLGAEVRSDNGLIPVRVLSKLVGGITEIDGGISSQLLTGLLIALPAAERDSVVNVKNLKSRQYVDITIRMLEKFSVKVTGRNYSEFTVKGGQRFVPSMVEIEGDWSGAAFILCAGAIAGKTRVAGLQIDSVQPDRA